MDPRVVPFIIAAAALPLIARSQTTTAIPSDRAAGARVQNGRPTHTVYIVKYYVEPPAPKSSFETGALHILYNDGSDFVEDLRPKQSDTADEVVENEEGIVGPRLADDKQTIGWTENYDDCCTSYSIPLALVLFKAGKVVRRIEPGQMIWYWTFLDQGSRVAVVSGATHGPEVGHYQLYDVNTGRMIAEIYGDEKSQQLASDSPEWARCVEEQMRNDKK